MYNIRKIWVLKSGKGLTSHVTSRPYERLGFLYPQLWKQQYLLLWWGHFDYLWEIIGLLFGKQVPYFHCGREQID